MGMGLGREGSGGNGMDGRLWEDKGVGVGIEFG